MPTRRPALPRPRAVPTARANRSSRSARSAAERAAAEETAAEMECFRARVYRLVALIPRGQVATYGQLSLLAGHPRRARHVGNALRHPPPALAGSLPWHRVLNAQGRVSERAGESRPRGDEPVERRQKRLLVAEGIAFRGDRVPLERYRWQPEAEGLRLVEAMRDAPRAGRRPAARAARAGRG